MVYGEVLLPPKTILHPAIQNILSLDLQGSYDFC